MILALTTFTWFHVVLSLIGIITGFIVAFGLLAAKRLDGWTAIFLLMTVLTSVTGYFFPFHGVTPAQVVGAISLLALLLAIIARYSRHLEGGWRQVYVVTAMFALYLNVFVLIVQSFDKFPRKISALKAFAPPQTTTPFLILQVAAFVVLLVLTIAALRKFRAA
jgi:hypothetical protein